MEPWYEGSTRAPHVFFFLTGFGPWGGKVLQGSTGFHKGPPRWFHHFYRFRKGCSTKVFTRFCTGFHEAEVRFYKAPQFHKGSTNLLWREAMRRAPSEKPVEQSIEGSGDRLAHGRNTKQNRAFSRHGPKQ